MTGKLRLKEHLQNILLLFQDNLGKEFRKRTASNILWMDIWDTGDVVAL